MLIIFVIPFLFILTVLGIWLAFKHRYKISLLILLSVSCVNSITQQIPLNCVQDNISSNEIRILEYNVCAKKAYRGKHESEFVNFIVQQDADILVLPENYIHRVPELDRTLSELYPYNLYTAMSKNKPPYVASLYSRYPLSDVERMIDYKTQNKSQRNVRAVVDINDRKITLYCIHAASNSGGIINGYKERENELETLLKEINRRETEEFMVIGDFNDLSGSKFLRTLQNENLRDAWWDRGSGFGFTFKEGIKRLRLDHILVSPGIKVNRVWVNNEADYSDHLPLIADFQF